MKRIISCLLAVILVFSLCVDTSAEPVDTETAGSGPDVVAEGDGETGTGENENLLQEDNEGTEDEEDSETEEGAGPENTDEPESGSEPSEKNLFTVNPDDASFGTEDEEGQEDGVGEKGFRGIQVTTHHQEKPGQGLSGAGRCGDPFRIESAEGCKLYRFPDRAGIEAGDAGCGSGDGKRGLVPGRCDV